MHRFALSPRGGDSYVVLASDGLYDVLTDADVIECANKVLKVGLECVDKSKHAPQPSALVPTSVTLCSTSLSLTSYLLYLFPGSQGWRPASLQ